MRLHGYVGSINVRKVLWLAAELRVEIELVERGTPRSPVSDPAYRDLNPLGLVPCLEDRGRVIAESNTILRYLARREQRDDLLPRDPGDAAGVETWLDWQATDLNDSWRPAFMARYRSSPGAHTDARYEASLRAFNAKMGIIDGQLARSGRYMAGQTFTLADIVIGLSIRRWHALDGDVDRHPAIANYYARLCRREAFVPHGGPDSPP